MMLEPKEKVLELMKLIGDDAPKEQLSKKATEVRDYFSALSRDQQTAYNLFLKLLQSQEIQCV